MQGRSDDVVKPFPLERRLVVDGLDLATKKHMIHGFVELDVTGPRQRLRACRERTGEAVSFTGFVAVCLARAVAEHPACNTYRLPFSRTVTFRDVDVAVLVERALGEDSLGTFHLVRAAQAKGVLEVHREIRAAQRTPLADADPHGALRLFLRLPRFVRRVAWRVLANRPRVWKRMAGTVALSSVGMHDKGLGFCVPIAQHTLGLTLGGLASKPAVVDGRVEIREVLSVTLSVDHDLVDGAPAARFARRFQELVEAGFGLDELGEPAVPPVDPR